MKLSDWANVAEILSGIAVVVTLIVLVAGVRANTATVRAATYADMLESANEFENQMITDPEIRNIYLSGISNVREGGEPLTDSERLIFGLIMQSMFRKHDIAYTMRRYELLDEEIWPEVEEDICNTYERAAANDVEWALNRLRDEFAEYIRSTCSEGL